MTCGTSNEHEFLRNVTILLLLNRKKRTRIFQKEDQKEIIFLQQNRIHSERTFIEEQLPNGRFLLRFDVKHQTENCVDHFKSIRK